jgi:hypothetical protein
MQKFGFGMRAVIGEQQGDKRLTEGDKGCFGMQPRKNTKKKSWQRSRRQIEGN